MYFQMLFTVCLCSDGLKYAADVKDMILTATCGHVAGFMSETIQGVGGSIPLASGYLPEVYKVCALMNGPLSLNTSFK